MTTAERLTLDPATPLSPRDPIFGRTPFPEWVTEFRPPQWRAIVEAYEAFGRGAKFVFIDAPTGTGKAQPRTEPVLTPDGWRMMGDLRVGDYVMGTHGPTRVTGVFPQGRLPCFEVTFSDGATTRCNDEHLWSIRGKYGTQGVKTLREMMQSGLRNRQGGRLHFIPVVAVEYAETDLPIDPYTLGALLGDGSLTHGLGITTSDAVMENLVLPEGVDKRLAVRITDTVATWRLSTGQRGGDLSTRPVNGLLESLRDLGLMGHGALTKFIPPAYLTASIKQRQALLQGLLDTDGYKSKTGQEYATSSPTLAQDVTALVRSLGGSAMTRSKIPTYTYKGEKKQGARSYTVTVRFLGATRALDKVEEVGVEEMICISVEAENSLYVTRDYIVTHNTIIGETVRRLLAVEKTNYVCTTKSLQRQFHADFHEYAKVLMGRSNYPTLDHPDRFGQEGAYGLSAEDCEHTKELLPACDRCDQTHNSTVEEPHCLYCHPVKRSPYVLAKEEAAAAEIAVLNTAYMLAANNTGATNKPFDGRGLVIADECDCIEGVLMGYVGVEISGYWVKRLGISPPDRKTGEAKTGQSWHEWIAKEALPKIVKGMKGGGLRTRQKKTLTGMQESLTRIMHDLSDRERQENWVYMETLGDGITFKPVRVDEFADRYLWSHADKWLLMSATLIDPHEQVSSLGIPQDQWDIVVVDGGFPVERRPIVVLPTADMSRKGLEADPQGQHKVCMKTAQIAMQFPNERILVHTVSYQLTREMVEKVGSVLPNRPLIHYTSARDREQALAEFKATPGAICFAPSFDRGVDLSGDACRVQVICKMPFASLGDKQVAKRLYTKDGSLWYSVNTIRVLVQMTGRAMRSRDDHCITFVLDKQFVSNVWSKSKKFIPKWWSTALVWNMQTPQSYLDIVAEGEG